MPFGSLLVAGVALAVGGALVVWIVAQVIIPGPPLHASQGIFLSRGMVILAPALRLRSHPDR